MKRFGYVVLLLLFTFGLVSCFKNETNNNTEPTKHEHVWVAMRIEEDNPEYELNHNLVCEICEEKKIEPHTFSDWIISRSSENGHIGIMYKECTKCYARVEKSFKDVTITYDLKGGEYESVDNNPKSLRLYEGDTITFNSVPLLNHYTFKNWAYTWDDTNLFGFDSISYDDISSENLEIFPVFEFADNREDYSVYNKTLHEYSGSSENIYIPNRFDNYTDADTNIINEIDGICNYGYNTVVDNLYISEGITKIENSFKGTFTIKNMEMPKSLLEFSHSFVKESGNMVTGYVTVENIYYSGTLSDWLKIKQWSGFNGTKLYFLNENGDKEFDGKKYSLFEDLIIDDGMVLNHNQFAGISSIKNVYISKNINPDSTSSYLNRCDGILNVYADMNIKDWMEGYYSPRIVSPHHLYLADSNGDTTFNNKKFSLVTDVVASNDSFRVFEYCFMNCVDLRTVTLNQNVTIIWNLSFTGCSSLSSINIPKEIEKMNYRLFYGCVSLSEITFDGTIEEWNALEKDAYWNEGSAITKVICTDGNVNL